MALLRLNRRILLTLQNITRVYSTSSLSLESEYTETPQYPEILDITRQKVRERELNAYGEEIKAVKTVEEKQIKLNMPKYYGFICYIFKEDYVPYNNLELSQHITRTHLVECDTLPDPYNAFDVDKIVADIKPDIEEALLLEYGGYQKRCIATENPKVVENVISSSISKQFHRILLNSMCENFPHLNSTQTDTAPRIESSWLVGGMNPPAYIKNIRSKIESLKNEENEPVDRIIQYIGQPNLTLRSELALSPILSYNELEAMNLDVPVFKYSPRTVGAFTERRRLVNTPGFWPGDTYKFGLLSYHNRGHMLERLDTDLVDEKEAIHRQGIMASYGWLHAQANFLGFTTFNDITYPLVTQCIVTNGQLWSFYVYQLNTMLFHHKNIKENPKKNICWATKEMKLFEEIQDGKIIGFNEDVLKTLVKFYSNASKSRDGVELEPYLSKEEKLIADYEDDEKRQWLEREYKFITSNRPRHTLPYEIYHWEKIYKIDHKKRPFEARRRPFELFIDPWKRKYDERQSAYIPRKLRPHLKHNQGRYAKEYFP